MRKNWKTGMSLTAAMALFLTYPTICRGTDQAQTACVRLHLKILELEELAGQPGLQWEADTFDESLLSPLIAVIRQKNARGERLPDLSFDALINRHQIRIQAQLASKELPWNRNAVTPDGTPALAFGSRVKPIHLEQLGDYDSPVYLFTHQGARYIFRPASPKPGFNPARVNGLRIPYRSVRTSTTAARKTIAAQVLSDALGLDYPARSRAGQVNGVWGAISEFVEGPQTHLLRDRGVTALSESGRADANGFEFLAGDGWSHDANVIVLPNGQGKGFDWDQAFIPFLPRVIPNPPYYRGHGQLGSFYSERGTEDWHQEIAHTISKQSGRYPLGRTLGPLYTRRFIEGLQRNTPARLRKLLGHLLSESEVEGALLRRELILEYVRQRGAASLL